MPVTDSCNKRVIDRIKVVNSKYVNILDMRIKTAMKWAQKERLPDYPQTALIIQKELSMTGTDSSRKC
jgi:hypothetical protein